MERKRRLHGGILMPLIAVAGLCCACSAEGGGREADIRIRFAGDALHTRAIDPDEERLSDISLMIFDETGTAEECFWMSEGMFECSARLVYGKKYIFCACANFGYQVYAEHIGELDEIRYHLAYPDEYSLGMPMFARQETVIEEGSSEVFVILERLMAKISLRMDRRQLSEDVEMLVRSVQIGNCPRSVSVFKKNKVSDEDDCFPAGFTRSDYETALLNRVSESGISNSVSLYMLENMQGEFGGNAVGDSDKIFGKDDYRKSICSYVELELEYKSDEYYSSGKGLVYRFYLGEGLNSLDVERNCHYHITVIPEDDGLSDDGWRVDKTDLKYCGPTSFKPYPSPAYIVGDIGDKIHIGCHIYPEDTPFDVGISYMEDDRKSGIYDYVIDEDGHGAILTLTGPGAGLIYMEAGEPINDAALFHIEVNLPK